MANTQIPTWFSRLCFCAAALALCVVMLGAYTRLTHAGLGCPDWPGCYGKMIVSQTMVEPTKAWTEMIHRYVAGTLALMVFIIGVSTYRYPTLHRFRLHSSTIVLLIIFQALLGMWTVTLKLHPTVVLSHLMGGMTVSALLWWLYLRTCDIQLDIHTHSRIWTYAYALGLIIVFMQVILGGWTSANYAALACTDFPTCHGSWWPNMHWGEAFSMTPPLDQNYEGGWLEHPARVTIHMMHRLGAMIVTTYLILISIFTFGEIPALRRNIQIILFLLVLQLTLGVSNIVFFVPLSVALMHNGGAVLLLLSLVSLNYQFYRMEQRS